MNIQKGMIGVMTLIGVMIMQLATTVQEVTPAVATLDTQGMDFLAQVIMSTKYLHKLYLPNNQPFTSSAKAHYLIWEINHQLSTR